MRTFSSLLLPALLLTLVTSSSGCTYRTNLDGGWDGEVDCGAGSVPIDISIDLDRGSRTGSWEGDGTISWYDGDGFYWQVDFDLDVDHAPVGASRALDLDLAASRCSEIDMGPIECGRIEGTWHVQDSEIEGDLELFDLTCTFEID